MPHAPSVDFITTFIFENYWPGALLLLVAAGILAVVRHRGSRRSAGIAAAGCVAAAAGLIVIANVVTTSGERARAVTTTLVNAAEAGDVATARAQFADDATFSFVRPENPGESIDYIQRSLEQLRGRYSIADNHVPSLRAYSASADRAVVHLRVITRLEQFPYAIPSSWVLDIGRQGDGSWKIDHITFVEYSGQSPGRDVFR